MKINFLLPSPPWIPVGGYRVVYEYANRLAEKNHEISVIHASHLKIKDLPIKRRIKEFVGHCFFKSVRPSINWQSINPKVKILYVWQPILKNISDADAIFATSWQTAEYVNDYGPEKGKKYYLVMDFDPWLGSYEELLRTWKMPFRKITISAWLTGKVVSGGVTDVYMVPIGIDFSRFKLINPIENRSGMISIMFHRALYKDIKTGIKALEICKNNFPDIKVFAFGPDKSKPDLLQEWIIYYGRLSDEKLVRLYNETSIFVSSSIAEGFSLPPAEAMACGCAVVATDCGGIRDYAKHGVNCLLSQPQDEHALAENIIKLLKDDTLRKNIAIKGSEDIKNFNWEKSTTLLENLLVTCK